MTARLVWRLCGLVLLVLHCHSSAIAASRNEALITTAERTSWKQTGRYAEVERMCAAFASAWPANVRCTQFGRSPEGRPMLLLVASADGTLDAATARGQQRPVVLMQGGIHAGEIDGKDAGFLALREMLEGRVAPGALQAATFVFVPVFSVDGHERFGRWNRPNQVGPEEMGWRTTAQNLNLNRDYVKAEAPEMQAMLRLLGEWDPILYADLHVTDGADFEHDISITVTPTLAGDEQLRGAASAFTAAMMRRLAASGSLPLDFYPAFVRDDDPQSGFAVSVPPARFSQAYWALHNRIGVLVETHSWKDYATRVRGTRNSIIAMMELTAQHGGEWLRIAKAADERTARIGGTPVAMAFDNTDHVTMLDFRGYAYTREPSAISGNLVTRYDNKRPQIWRIPLLDQVKPAITVVAPRGGYIVPAAHAEWIAQKLALHGIRSQRIGSARNAVDVQAFRATKTTLAATTFEGRTALSIAGHWQPEKRDVPAGSLFVPISQPAGRVAMTLLEPLDPDSLVSWGFFNGAFEQKEYMEAYVAEQVAAEMLKKDPAVKAEFEKRLSEDKAFAQSPVERLNFFYRRHSAWDERLNLYPVYRVETDSGW